MTKRVEVLILGGGVAGLGAGIQAQRMGMDSLILERDSRPGGLCKNTTVLGCDFDMGPKILLLDDSDDAEDILSFLDGNYVKYPMIEKTYLKDLGLVGFPLQRHLIDLPEEQRNTIVREIQLLDPNRVPYSYEDWLRYRYGDTLSENVLLPYELKKWQIPLKNLDYKWALDRPVRVDLSEILRGSKEALEPNRWYYYPEEGNISNLSNAMAQSAGEIRYDQKITEINIVDKFVISNGQKLYYQNLISSMPLDAELRLIGEVAELFDANETKQLLQWLSVKVFNLVFEGNHDLDGTAIYFPESDFICRRVSILQNLCPALRRDGYTPISVEVSLTHDNTTTNEAYLAKILDDLSRIVGLNKLKDLSGHAVITIENAYPQQIVGMHKFVTNIHEVLRRYDVYHCGRGGNFDYCNSDIAYSQGKALVLALSTK